jgi:hypothetical protein
MTANGQHLKEGQSFPQVQHDEPPVAYREIGMDPRRNNMDVIYLGEE